MRDAQTGEIIWGVKTGQDTGRGVAADIDPDTAVQKHGRFQVHGTAKSAGFILHKVKKSLITFLPATLLFGGTATCSAS